METLAAQLKSILSEAKTKTCEEFLASVMPLGRNEIKNRNKKTVKRKAPKKVSKPRPKSSKSSSNSSSSRNSSQEKRNKESKLKKDLILDGYFAHHETDSNFTQRAGYDPYDSSKDPVLREIGKKGGDYVKQNIHSYQYSNWHSLQRDQTGEFQWNIWLDPSAGAHVIFPRHT